jgi:hypothetical protein
MDNEMRLARSTRGKKNKYAQTYIRRTCKKEHFGRAELRPECSKVDIKIILLCVCVCVCVGGGD